MRSLVRSIAEERVPTWLALLLALSLIAAVCASVPRVGLTPASKLPPKEARP